MRWSTILLAFALVASISLAANMTINAPVTEVTLYSNNYAFVTRSGTAQLPAGGITLLIANMTRSAVTNSISPTITGASLSEFYTYNREWNETVDRVPVSLWDLLNRSMGSNITFIAANSTKTGKLVWFDSEFIGIASNSGVTIYKLEGISQLTSPVSQFTEEVNETKSEHGLALGVQGSGGQGSARLTYLVQGPGWEAHYKYYMGSEGKSGTGTLQGWANVQNEGGEDWNGVRLRLVVGYPHLTMFYLPRYYAKADYAAGAAEAAPSAPQFTPSQVSAYYVYTMQVPATVKDGESRNLQLFERGVGYKREYFWETSKNSPEKIFILNNTGNESWAAGVFRVYLNGDLLGEERADYTARNREARISVSDLPDIHATKESVNQTTREDGRSRTTSYKFRLTLENTMDEAIDLRINDAMYSGDQVRIISSSLPAMQKPGNVLEWNAHMEKGQTLEIDYEYEVTNFYPPRY